MHDFVDGIEGFGQLASKPKKHAAKERFSFHVVNMGGMYYYSISNWRHCVLRRDRESIFLGS